MAINFVRQPSETPNVRNIDDIIPFRYAYGNQNGYVKDKGNELSYTINGSNFRINSGRVVLFGVESDIDANGVTITVPSVATTTYYSIYYKVNMATNTTSIESESSEEDYPEIPIGDDLTANTSGSANLVLYTFIATNGIISNIEKVVQRIEYINKETKVNNATNSDTLQNVDLSDSSVATFGDYILPKKKLLWSGSVDIAGTSTAIANLITIDNSANYLDKTIEIEYVFGNALKKPKFFRIYSEAIAQTYMQSDIEVNFQSSLSSAYIDRVILWLRTAENNGIAGVCYYDRGDFSGNKTATTAKSCLIKKIYEIIE